MEKKNSTAKRQILRTVENTGLLVMVFVVVALTAAVIALLSMNAAFDRQTSFDMEQLLSSDADTGAEIEKHLLPSFIGIRTGGEQRGISAGTNVMCDIYDLFSPVLCDVLTDGFRKVSADLFESAEKSSSFVYLKYHTPLPYQAIYACAGGTEETYKNSVFVYELIILPDHGCRTLVRTADGEVYLFEGTYKSYFASDTLYELLTVYRRNMSDFMFSEDEGEPMFTERVRTKNMLVTEKTAALIQNRESHISAILRLMDFNPDKLYTHEESDSGFVYVENHGVLRLLSDSVEYTAASSDGGISVEHFLNRNGRTRDTLRDYMETACIIVSRIKALSLHYAGGEGEILLESVSVNEDGAPTLRFIYAFDNLRLSGCEPALEITFQNGRMMFFRLFSVSVKNLGVQTDSLLEEWYYETAKLHCPDGGRISDVSPVYKTDFYLSSISAEWAVRYVIRESDDGVQGH